MPAPQERVASSRSAIRAAEEMGADKVPAAALHLQLAREQSHQAEKLIKEKENLRASYVLMRAEADAELAIAMAREQPERTQAQEALERVQSLRQATEGK